MELREAIEEIRKANTRYFSQSSDLAKSVILEAIIDGTLIPTDACFNVDDGVLYQAMNDGYGRYDEFKRDVLMALEIRSADDVRREGYAEGYKDGFKKSGSEEMQRQTALIPAEQCFSVKEGYSASAFKNVDLEEGVGYSEDVPLTEALTIRSTDDVRREVFKEVLDLFESRPDAVKVIRAMIKGGDDE